MKLTYIYTLSDPSTGQVRYVGKTVNPDRRLSEHVRNAKNAKTRTHVQNWICVLNNQGLKPLQENIEVCGENWVERESFWIAYYRALHGSRITNATDGGEGACGCIVSPETRAKMSKSRKGEKSPMFGKKKSAETKAKISASLTGKNHPMFGITGKNHHNYGKKRSAETRAKMSKATKGENNPNYGKKMSATIREKISAAKKGKNTGEKNPNYGKKASLEARAKMSTAKKGKKCTDETKARVSAANKASWANNPMRSTKPILQIFPDSRVAAWPSTVSAARTTGISSGGICSVLKGRQKTCGGCKWFFVQDMYL